MSIWLLIRVRGLGSVGGEGREETFNSVPRKVICSGLGEPTKGLPNYGVVRSCLDGTLCRLITLSALQKAGVINAQSSCSVLPFGTVGRHEAIPSNL